MGSTFRPKATLIDMFKSLCNNYPSKTKYENIGRSYEWRAVTAFCFGNPNGGVVMWDGSMHGWEDIGSEVQYQIATWLLTSGTAEANRILERNFVVFVPIVNMDSYERENRDFATDSWGVDINRNFAYDFQKIPPANTGYPDSYHGDYAISEPETQAVLNAFWIYKPSVYVNCHYGGLPSLQSYPGRDSPATSQIKSRINDLSGNTFPWDMYSGEAGNGIAVGDALSFYVTSSWVWEIANDYYPIGSGGTTYAHTAHSLADIQNYFFPKMLPAFRAMCETCEIISQYTLTVLYSPNGALTPPQGVYTTQEIGDYVWLIAHPYAGYSFSNFVIDGVAVPAQYVEPDGDCTYYLHMNSSHTVQAVFQSTVPNYTLTIEPVVNGTLTPPQGVYTTQEIGDYVWLIAHPNSGFNFAYFLIDNVATPAQYVESDGDCTYYLHMNSSHTVQAVFQAAVTPNYTLTIKQTASGTLKPAPGVYSYPAITENVYITATPKSGYILNGWNITTTPKSSYTLNETIGASNPLYIKMQNNTSVTVQAIFQTKKGRYEFS